MNEKKVYIILTDTGTLFTRMIKLYTNKPYNHAAISFDTDLLNVYSFGRKTARNPFVGGFVNEDIESELFKQAACVIYSCIVSSTHLQEMRDYIQQMEEQKHLYRYNFLGLIAILLNIPLNRKNAFFCSQFVASVLKECDIIDFQKPLSLVTPHDLQGAAGFQLVYRGKFGEYPKQMPFWRHFDMESSDGEKANQPIRHSG